MTNNNWMDDLNILLAQFSHSNLNVDLAKLTIDELRGLYCYLQRLKGEL